MFLCGHPIAGECLSFLTVCETIRPQRSQVLFSERGVLKQEVLKLKRSSSSRDGVSSPKHEPAPVCRHMHDICPSRDQSAKQSAKQVPTMAQAVQYTRVADVPIG